MRNTRVVNIAVVVGLAALVGWVVFEVLDKEDASTDGPVIANEATHDYNLAEISGTLRLTNGCLTIDNWIAVFPYGTSWDEDGQAVDFDGDFADSDSVRVGERFEGGGGYYEGNVRTAFIDVVQDAVNKCMKATGLTGAVLAHPG